jgi:hypothetical protein
LHGMGGAGILVRLWNQTKGGDLMSSEQFGRQSSLMGLSPAAEQPSLAV